MSKPPFEGPIEPDLPTVFVDLESGECVESGFFKSVDEILFHVREFAHEWIQSSDPTDLLIYNGDDRFQVNVHLERYEESTDD